MEAATDGAFEAQVANSVGCNIQLALSNKSPIPTCIKSITFERVLLCTQGYTQVKYSYAFIIMPGGFGTLDEFFETPDPGKKPKTITQFPIVLFGKEYHAELWDYLEYMATQGTIAREDLNLVLLTDSVIDGAGTTFKPIFQKNYKIRNGKRRWWLLRRTRRVLGELANPAPIAVSRRAP